jgi:hypothetical protein
LLLIAAKASSDDSDDVGSALRLNVILSVCEGVYSCLLFDNANDTQQADRVEPKIATEVGHGENDIRAHTYRPANDVADLRVCHVNVFHVTDSAIRSKAFFLPLDDLASDFGCQRVRRHSPASPPGKAVRSLVASRRSIRGPHEVQ